ncbi:MAG: hypothetical protein RL102_18 [Actinomycetota bacterium]|jgi:predicted metal-dependent phosphoesterase TrpH
MDASPKIDLHVHSNHSDGRESVAEVIDEAVAAGLSVMALTDHDTTAGWVEAESLARSRGLGFVPGIEVTTRTRTVDADGNAHGFGVHMLAYLPDPNNEPLSKILSGSVEGRVERLQKIVALLSADFNLFWDDVLEHIEDGATPGRPAVADALIRLGHFENRGQVFEKLWYKGSQYYVPNTEVPTPEEAIALIRGAGGVPVIAHPLARGKRPENPDDFPRDHFVHLIELGLAGFEAFHRDVDADVADWLVRLAAEFDVFVTGSSDYHGKEGKPNRLGENSTSIEALRQIVEQGTGANAYIPSGIL